MTITIDGVDPTRVPKHIACVMDGNGRWAQQRGLKRTEGHSAGEKAMLETVYAALDVGVEWLTVYAFSTENWKRPVSEVRYLMQLNENILVRRAKPNFTAFIGSFTGTSRVLVVNGDGLVFESVSTTDSKGKTKPLSDVTYQLSEPRDEKGVARAEAVITKVKVYDRKTFKGHRIPHVGDKAIFRLEKGVVRSPYIGRLYCDGKAAKKGTCG